MAADPSNDPERTYPHKILVVDDEVGIRRGCERVLRSQGHQVLLADRGEQGLEVLRRQPDVDLVLVDLRMPGISGLDFLLQAREIAPETVFVVITAYATIEAAVEATKRGAYDFIAKPFNPDDLLRLANHALERVHLIRERNRLEAERQQRMLELSMEKSRMRTVIDCMADAVLVCNAEHLLVLHNPSALKVLSRAQPLHTPLPLGEALENKDLIQLISDAAEHQKRLSHEVRLSTVPNEIWALANVAPVVDRASSQFLGTVTVLRDITELKRVENYKAQFINMVVHELRSPLAAVDGFLSVMEKGYVQDEAKEKEIIARSKRRIGTLVDLVGDLLEVARMEAQTVQREIAPQKLDLIVKETLELMEPLANEKRIRLEAKVPDSLPPVHADRDELIRLFNNLVSNAVKYNRQEGHVRIAAEEDGPYIKVSVSDTGIGIGKKGLDHLFSEFFREKREETKNIKGTGLGLNIVKRIVDFYHGRIEVESELHKGSTFAVWLPFADHADSQGEKVRPPSMNNS